MLKVKLKNKPLHHQTSTTSIFRSGAFLLGFLSVGSQIILIRIFLSIFNGNELVVGIILCNWLLLTGVGALTGRYLSLKSEKFLFTIFLVYTILPLITALLFYFLHGMWFEPGKIVGLLHIFLFTALLLIPVCITSGIIYTYLVKKMEWFTGSESASEIYKIESIGSIIAGVLFNFILIWRFTSLHALIIISLLSIIIIWNFRRVISKSFHLVSSIVMIIILTTLLFLDLDQMVINSLFKNEKIVQNKESFFGKILVTRQYGQRTIFLNNSVYYSEGDKISIEESVHYAMVQNKSPEDILIVSGAVSEIFNEVSKYESVKSVDYVEMDKSLSDIFLEDITLSPDIKFTSEQTDPRIFIRNTKKKYDVILLNLPLPSSINLNRYFTREFYNLLGEILETDGVIAVPLTSGSNYLNDDERYLLSSIVNTAEKVFEHNKLLAGNTTFLLMSHQNVNLNIGKLIDQRGIETVYVNKFYIEDELLVSKSNDLYNQLLHDVQENTDYQPVTFLYSLNFWMSHFRNYGYISVFILSILLLVLFIRAKTTGKIMFIAGFSGSAMEMLILIGFQIVYGYAYFAIGILISLFMAGLVSGVVFSRKIIRKINYQSIAYHLFAIFTIVIILITGIEILSEQVPEMVLIILMGFLLFVSAVVVGSVFRVSSLIKLSHFSDNASEVYGGDLSGSALGALMVTIFLFPYIGFIGTAIVIAAINLLSGLITFVLKD